ncbi:MAG: ATP-binding cassette domain-containing protein [Bacillota bacterium]|nr:ATP-binding cassette domain-containing protein [Bacillota bacterium]
MPIVKVNNLVKRYGSILAVDNLCLSIEKGETFGLVGPNCAGKSTTIKMLVGLLKPDRGEIFINGIDIVQNHKEIKRNIGLVPQDVAIYENMSARENIEFFGSLYGLYGKNLKEMASEALEFSGLYEKQNERPKKFSGGMKRRLNIACSIVHKPQILIMDEPTVGIDAQSRNHILSSVKELGKSGTTVIYTSHYMEEVESLCTRIGIVDFGRIIAIGNKNELKNLIDSEEIVAMELDNTSDFRLDELSSLDEVSSAVLHGNQLQIVTSNSHGILQDIIEIILRQDKKIININLNTPSLENVFLKLTGRNLRD